MILDDAQRQGRRESGERQRADTVPGRLFAGLACEQDIVVLSSDAGGDPGRAAAEIVAATISLLHDAGFATASITAPLSLSVLHDAIREVLAEPVVLERPLIVVIEHAENLLLPTVRRLVALGALRRDARPVLRFLLAGTAELWPALRSAGLAGLEQDAAAHIRLAMPAGTATRAAIPPALDRRTRPREMGRDGRSLGAIVRVAVGLVMIVLIVGGTAALSWVAFGPAPKLAASVRLPTADEQLALLLRLEDRQIAAGQLDMPGGGGLIQTRQRIDALIPSLSQAALDRLGRANVAVAAALRSRAAASRHPAIERTIPAVNPASAATVPADDSIHVTVQYRNGATGAAARAAWIMGQLRDQDVLADGPVAVPGAVSAHASALVSRVDYYFPQDRSDADRMARLLFADGGVEAVLRPAPGGVLPRPGEISIMIGAQDDHSREHAASGKQT